MNKLNYILIFKFYLISLFNKKIKFDLILKDLELDFQNINFEDFNKLKNLYVKMNNNSKSANQDFYFKTFDWLVLAKKLGGVNNIKISNKNILYWFNNKKSLFDTEWNLNIANKRFLNLIYSYDFYSQILNKKETKKINRLLNNHHLFIRLQTDNLSYQNFTSELIKSNLLISLILNESVEKFNEKVILYLNFSIDKQGFHKSYNPSYQAEFINSIYEIKNIYLYFKEKVPKEIEFHLVNLTSVLNNLFHKDGSICLFNGSSNFNYQSFNKIINQLGYLKSRDLLNIENGIAIYNDNKKKLFFDVVKTTDNLINNNLHASTLSIEFSANKEKIITNCGALENRFKKNPEYLRYSAAHSTIIINNTNISELINKSSYSRTPKKIIYHNKQTEKEIILECSHDGYFENFGKIIKREVRISKKENVIFGKDTILSFKKKLQDQSFDIRFHLMSNSRCVLTNSKKSVLLKTSNNNSWIFEFNNIVRIEESILIENGVNVKQNKQIILSGFTKETKHVEKWLLRQI